MKVLFLTTILPGRRRMGSEVASQSIIDMLIDLDMDVTVAGYIRTNDNYQLSPYEICAGRRQIETSGAGVQAAYWFVRSILEDIPYSVAKYESSAFIAGVRNLMRTHNYDLVMLDHVQMSWLLDALLPFRGKVIGIAHNVEHQMYKSFASEQQGKLRRWVYERESRLVERMEISFAKKVDQLWVLTKSDAQFFASVIKDAEDIKEIPLPGSEASPKSAAETKGCDIGLVGSWTWKANDEGLRWFFDCVYPCLPLNMAIDVAGSGAKWLDGRFQNVRYLGFVDDVQTFLQKARVVAIPTLSGGGIQIKTLDAIASGSQIVATPLALRGIDDHPSTVAVAKTPEEFATLLRMAISSATTDASTTQAIQWSLSRRSRFRDEIMHGINGLVCSP